MRRNGFKWLPSSLASQILLVILVCSLVPLVLSGALTLRTTKQHLDGYFEREKLLTEKSYIQTYQTYMEAHIQSIETELQKVEHSVKLARANAEELFAHPERYPVPALTLVPNRYRPGYHDNSPAGEGMISYTGPKPFRKQALEHLARSRYLETQFKEEVRQNPNIAAMYYIHPDSGSFLYPAIPNNEALSMQTMPLTEYSFYKDALRVKQAENKVIWTQPYYDITPNGWMFTATSPVYGPDGTLLGTIGADVTINNFVRNVLDVHFTEQNAYAFLLEASGDVIAIQSQGKAEILTLPAQALSNAERQLGSREVTLGGEPKLLFVKSVPSSGWLLGYVVPKRELLLPVVEASSSLVAETGSRLLRQIMTFLLAALLLCLSLSLLLWTRISKPLTTLMRAFGKASLADFSVKLQDGNIREFNRLQQTFNQMSDTISDLLNQQKQLNEELELKVAERTEALSHAHMELQVRFDELKKLESWRKRWIANMSHDLRTPITIVRGYLEALQDGTIKPEQSLRFLQKAHDRMDTMSRLVKDLNDLSLLETKQTQLRLEIRPAAPLFIELASGWSEEVLQSGRRLRIDMDPHVDGEVLADKDMLNRVLDNLLSNAIKYSPPQTLISIDLTQSDDWLMLSVSDEGVGIPDEALPYIFDSFFRVDASRNSSIPGSGLGLAIAREIMHAHGGRLEAMHHDAGKPGTTFIIYLPRYVD